jgi:holo-[acyl-carrier-protein] synthase
VIIGIGTDLIELDRVKKACEKEHFLTRIFTEDEIKLIHKDDNKSADNFAVKEAVSKMFGTGFREIDCREIEVLRDELGKPYVKLYGKALQLAEQLKIQRIHVSISNTKKYSTAFVVGESVES